MVWTAPDYHAAVVILTNRTGAIFFRSARKAIDLLIPPVSAKPADTATKDLPISAAEIDRDAGLYVNNDTIRTELANQEGKLVLKLGGRSFPVHKTGPLSFTAPGSGQLEQFRLVEGPGWKAAVSCRGILGSSAIELIGSLAT